MFVLALERAESESKTRSLFTTPGDLVLIGNYRIKPAYPHPHGPPWELTLNAGTSYLFRLDRNPSLRTFFLNAPVLRLLFIPIQSFVLLQSSPVAS